MKQAAQPAASENQTDQVVSIQSGQQTLNES